MAGAPSGAVLRDIQSLFDTGTASGLSDRQLLERFASRRDASAEAAFEALVLRHGPMVLRVCCNVLGDCTDAQDAFQATFLVLVKRSGSIRRLESVGSWLYGVACRVAARARVEAARRRTAERRGGLRVIQVADSTEENQPDHAEFGPIIQEEVQRLPEKYRAVVALCYWQGLTQEQAAAQLGCPLGTVRSRLARARGKLHTRLTRRGLAPLAGIVAAALDGSSAPASVSASASRLSAVPAELVRSTIRAAAQVAGGQGTAQLVSGTAASLVERVLRNMTTLKICKAITAFCLAGVLVVGAGLWTRQTDERVTRPQTQRVVGEKAKRAEQGKSGPAPAVEPTDLVIVEVLEALPGRPISGERLVRPDGTISLGFYGDVHVAGLTLPEIKAKIVRHMAKYLSDDLLGLIEYDPETLEPLVDPRTGKPKMIDPKDTDRVFVDVTGYNSGVYYVEGDVSTPSRLSYTGNETVLDVIHYVGGLLPSADRSKIRLIRSFPKGSAVQVLPVDYEEITMGTDSSTNYQLLPNDRLVVPRQRDDRSRKSGSPRPPRSGPSRPGISSSPASSSTAPAEVPTSLRRLQRQLNEIGRELNRLIDEQQSANQAPHGTAAQNAAVGRGSQSPDEPEAEPASPSKPE